MADVWGALGALAAVVLPMALAGWLLTRPARPARPTRGPRRRMPPRKGR
ncbi:MAG: hypothetical protein LCI02_08595 [Proteobacteria bacterium]|nr:hypothetical protein [Pseudomonadota bacterium]